MSVGQSVKYVSRQALSGQIWSVLKPFVPDLPFREVIERIKAILLLLIRRVCDL